MTYSAHHEEQLALLADQVAALQTRHPDLALVRDWSGCLALQGELWFIVNHEGRSIEDKFRIKVEVPTDYPESPPQIYETGGRLAGFDHLFPDGSLCLGAPVHVRACFARQPNLLSFVDDLVVPFLFAFSYKNRHGEMPFGELSHGVPGILAYYMDFFGASKESTIALLMHIAGHEGPHASLCPCGSRRGLKRCHGPRLNALRPYQTPQTVEDDLREMISANEIVGESRRAMLPRRLRRRLEKQLAKKLAKQRRRPSRTESASVL